MEAFSVLLKCEVKRVQKKNLMEALLQNLSLKERVEEGDLPAALGDDPSPHTDGTDTAGIAMMAELPEDAEAAIRKVLVLIDFNGMLVYKDKNHSIRSSELPSFVGGTGRGTAIFYLRAGCRELVARLSEDPRCTFGIYTSMQRHNVVPFFSLFDEAQLKFRQPFKTFSCGASSVSTVSQLSKVKLLFDQKFNDRDPKASDPYAFKRNLNLVWEDRSLRHEGYGRHNTVLIEGEPEKSRDWKMNTITPKEFDAQDVSRNCEGDSVLEKLGAQIDLLLGKMQDPKATVPDLIKDLKL